MELSPEAARIMDNAMNGCRMFNELIDDDPENAMFLQLQEREMIIVGIALSLLNAQIAQAKFNGSFCPFPSPDSLLLKIKDCCEAQWGERGVDFNGIE